MMNTKYELTFTEDNSIEFTIALGSTDENMKDIPPTLLIMTDTEKAYLQELLRSEYLKKLANKANHNIPIPKELISLMEKVESLVW